MPSHICLRTVPPMKRLPFALLAVLACFGAPAAAHAAASPWETVEGGRVRLVVEDLPSAGPERRAALEIELESGWKTYWRDPGASGVPPSLTASAQSDFAVRSIGYPAPEWFADPYGAWAGYKHSILLPVTLEQTAPDANLISVDAFLGICETICIPLQTRFEVTIVQQPASTPDDGIVAQAFAALPAPADDAFGVVSAKREGDKLTIAARPKGDAQAELFLAAGDGYSFTRPQAGPSQGTFTARLLTVPKKQAGRAEIAYTLVVDGRAVSGTFELE